MSVDWFLLSPSHRKSANVGSVGFGGVKPWPGHVDVVEFIRWAIEENVKDIVLVDEHDARLEEAEDD